MLRRSATLHTAWTARPDAARSQITLGTIVVCPMQFMTLDRVQNHLKGMSVVLQGHQIARQIFQKMMTDTDSIEQTTSSLERYLAEYLNFSFQHVLLTPSVWYTVARLRNRLFED